MQAHQLSWTEASGWSGHYGADPNLVLFFGAREALACGSRYRDLRQMFPRAHILGCSTGGQILNDDVCDDEIAATALRFDATRLALAYEAAEGPERSRACGDALGRTLAHAARCKDSSSAHRAGSRMWSSSSKLERDPGALEVRRRA